MPSYLVETDTIGADIAAALAPTTGSTAARAAVRDAAPMPKVLNASAGQDGNIDIAAPVQDLIKAGIPAQLTTAASSPITLTTNPTTKIVTVGLTSAAEGYILTAGPSGQQARWAPLDGAAVEGPAITAATTYGVGVARVNDRVPTPPQAGGSMLEPGVYEWIFGASEFCKRVDDPGIPWFNPADKYAAGQNIIYQYGQRGAGVNVSQYTIPHRIVDTRFPPGTSEGGNYQWITLTQYLPEGVGQTATDPWGYTYANIGNGTASGTAGIPFPVDLLPSLGTDATTSVLDVATGNYWDFWKQAGTFPTLNYRTAAYTAKVNTKTRGAHEYGNVVASRLWGTPMLIGIEECRRAVAGDIDAIRHKIGLELPAIEGRWNNWSWPAQYSDGRDPFTAGDPEWIPVPDLGIYMGSVLRLDPAYDVMSLPSSTPLQRLRRAVARSAQRYGLIVTDSSGSVAIRVEHQVAQWGQLGITSSYDLLNPAYFPWSSVGSLPKRTSAAWV